jgi:magnesium transporter
MIKVPSEVSELASWKIELNSVPPADAGDKIATLPKGNRAVAFRLLTKEHAINVFEYLPVEVQEELINALYDQQVRQLVDLMSPDDRALLFDELPAKIVSRLLAGLSAIERDATATILGYADGTAGRIMTTEYVQLKGGLTVAQAILKIKAQDRDKETIYYAYITDENRKLIGVVSLRQLFFSLPEVLIADLATPRLIKVFTEDSQKEVATVMKRYDLLAIPVVDREERLVGIITFDDAIDVVEEEATTELQKLVGGGGYEYALCSPLETFTKRLPWLIGNIALYMGAASVISPFQEAIAMAPIIAVIMPILSNTSGNVGIQALAVTVRALGTGEITAGEGFKVLKKELLAGIGLGIALGVTVASLAYLINSSQQIAIAAGVAMAINVLVGVSLGTMLPVLLRKFGLDPALVSGPLVTTLLDALMFFFFLMLITWLG